MALSKPLISISVISHDQTGLVDHMLDSLHATCDVGELEVLLTENLPPDESLSNKFSDLNLRTIVNLNPKGFAANHNQAFRYAEGKYFCIINPDVLFVEELFPQLARDIEESLGDIVSPLVVDSRGDIQDSYRSLPSPSELLFRRIEPTQHEIFHPHEELIYPDWMAGIFMIMLSETFDRLNGLDEQYKMYFEDVDFGTRARLEGYKLLVDTRYRLIHDAQRMSRRSPQYLLLHLISAFRFFTSDVYRNAKKENPE